jgi:putative ABC transport system substrate-binding protein
MATKIGVRVEVVRASNRTQYAAAFDAFEAAGVQVVVVGSFPVFFTDAPELARIARERRLPTICEWREMAEAGCLISYGPSNEGLRLRVADFVVRVLRGANPGELPMERAATFELALNAGVARALGVTVSPVVLARSDVVID